MKFQVYSRIGLRGRRWYWRLRAANGEIIAQGEAYANKTDAIYAVRLVMSTRSATPLEELG